MHESHWEIKNKNEIDLPVCDPQGVYLHISLSEFSLCTSVLSAEDIKHSKNYTSSANISENKKHV